MATSIFNTKDVTDYFNPIASVFSTPHYLFAARHTPWEDDLAIPDMESNPAFLDFQIRDEIIFGKLITEDDLAYMTRRVDWTYGTVYDRYDHTDNALESKDFYVVYPEAGSYHVFKCLDNNNGAESEYPPKLSETSIQDSQYYTADGYHWKYIYSVTSDQFEKFSTADHMPVFANSQVTVFATDGSIDSCILSSGGSAYYSHANGTFSQIAVGGNTQVFALNPLTTSSNTNFYVGSTVYIKSGSAAGEIRDIISYQIVGNTHLMGVNTSFSTLPDLTSVYDIAPKVEILGDGDGATAICSVNTITNAIQGIQMITEGEGYTFATVGIYGNTGSTVVANSAVAIAAISPRGGHASDPLSELYSNRIGVAVSYLPTDTIIPKYGSYRRVGIIAEPSYSNVVVNYINATSSFVVGEQVVQRLEDAFTISVYDSREYQYSHQYTTSKYKILQFAAPVNFANDHYITQGGTNGVVVDKITTNSILVRTDAGTWVNGTSVILASNNQVNGTISSISQGMIDGTILGRDNANTLFTFDAASDSFAVFVGNTSINHSSRAQPTDPQYSTNATHLVISNYTVNATTTVYIDRYSANLAQEELVSDNGLFVRGTITAQNTTAITLTDVTGRFSTNTDVSGLSSATDAVVSSVSGQETTFDMRTVVVGTYDVGSGTFVEGTDIIQLDDDGETQGWGTIHQITNVGATYTVYLTAVKGVIETAKYIQSASGDKKILVSAVTGPNIVPYSGSIRYVENFLPVQRANTQIETVRLVLTFY